MKESYTEPEEDARQKKEQHEEDIRIDATPRAKSSHIGHQAEESKCSG